MTLPPMTTAELRAWRRKGTGFTGKIYRDMRRAFDDGEDVEILVVTSIQEYTSCYVVKTDTISYTLPKNEELKP